MNLGDLVTWAPSASNTFQRNWRYGASLVDLNFSELPQIGLVVKKPRLYFGWVRENHYTFINIGPGVKGTSTRAVVLWQSGETTLEWCCHLKAL